VSATPSGPNRAPVISGAPSGSVVAGEPYAFTPTASDADGNPLTFGVVNRPAWATFTSSNGRLSGTPQLAHVGVYRNVMISVSDGQSTIALAPFDIVVEVPNGNAAPTISGTPLPSVAAGSTYNFVPTAADADGDTLSFSIANKPAWASFDTQTGHLTGAPGTGESGTFANILISVSDGAESVSLPAFSITVTPATTNTAPIIMGTPATTAAQGTVYSFQPTATDPDGDTLTFTIANRPTWATFNTNTGRLQGTPGATHVRTYSNIVISVNDGQASTPLPAFAITVTASNRPPTIAGSPSTSATVGTQYVFQPTASDADGNALTFSIQNRPSWATFSTSTGRLQGTPTAANVGSYGNIVISVSDGQASAQLSAFAIIVSESQNRAPTISGAPSTVALPGTPYAFQPSATDADGDTLTYNVANAPSWATFSATTGRLEGTPTAGDVGTTSGIVITVSDGEATASLAAFSITVQALATGSATLHWASPTTNSDGSPLTNLSGFKIYWGPAPGTYPSSVSVDNPGLTSYVVGNLAPGTYYFAISAYNATGLESGLSNVASKTIQ
jgi:hypothetical protein